MRDLAFVHDGDGFEAAVRMLSDAAGVPGRFESHRARVVQEQKGTQLLAVALVGQQCANGKTVADPVLMRSAVHAKNSLHIATFFLESVTRSTVALSLVARP